MRQMQHREHTLQQYDLVTSCSEVVIMIINNQFNECIKYLKFKQVDHEYTFTDFFNQAKTWLDNELDGDDLREVAPVVYRQKGLKYMILNGPVSVCPWFVKGTTKYVYSHTKTEYTDTKPYKIKSKEYHYKAIPVICAGDIVKLDDDRNAYDDDAYHGDLYKEVLFIENKNDVDYYYLKDQAMNLHVITSFDAIEEYISGPDIPSDLIIDDKNDAKISLRLPTYLLDILRMQSHNDEHNMGMSLNSTVRECLLYALDNYMNRLM